MRNPMMGIRSWPADQRTAYYREQANNIRQMVEAEPLAKIRARLLARAEQYEVLAKRLGENLHGRLA